MERFPRLIPLRAQRDERAGASEALAVCDPCSGSAAIRFLGSDYATARSRSVISSSSRRGQELHSDHLPASTVVHDFEQRTMATSANGASDALGMEPFAGYILFSSLCQFMVFMCCVVSVTFYMPWIYVILVLVGMFKLSCLYVFDHDLGSYMIYNLDVIFVLSCLGIYEHVNHLFCIHVNIYDAMLQLFIILCVIIMQLLFFGIKLFRIKLCRKLSKFLTPSTLPEVGGGPQVITFNLEHIPS
jgi:hypothetical protein